MTDLRKELLADLLPKVSRSFALTLRVLPSAVRDQIGLAYLLARTTDTVADTELVPVTNRLAALESLRRRITGTGEASLDFGELARQQGSPAERELLERCSESVRLLATLPEPDKVLICQVLGTISSGQELDLRRFAHAAKGSPIALGTDEELDDYTYRVAGCVGEFWTRICRLRVFPGARIDEARLLAEGVRFGKGLQLVNILRDVAADLARGRCYLPLEKLQQNGLSAADLLDPKKISRFQALYSSYLDKATAHLLAGWNYTNALPWRCARVRLACAWPILIGLDTIELLRGANPLDSQDHVKISRERVKKLVWRSVLRYPWPAAWRRLVRH